MMRELKAYTYSMPTGKGPNHASQQYRDVLGIPAIIWLLQLGYVVLALGLLALLSLKLHHQVHQPTFQVGYVLIMIAVNIVWRVAIRRRKAAWFQR